VYIISNLQKDNLSTEDFHYCNYIPLFEESETYRIFDPSQHNYEISHIVRLICTSEGAVTLSFEEASTDTSLDISAPHIQNSEVNDLTSSFERESSIYKDFISSSNPSTHSDWIYMGLKMIRKEKAFLP